MASRDLPRSWGPTCDFVILCACVCVCVCACKQEERGKTREKRESSFLIDSHVLLVLTRFAFSKKSATLVMLMSAEGSLGTMMMGVSVPGVW